MRRKLLNLRGSERSSDDESAVFGLPVDITEDAIASPVVESASAFDALLSQEMQAPTVVSADLPAPQEVEPATPEPARGRTDPVPPAETVSVNGLFEIPSRSLVMTGGFQELGFWDRYDEATASAELFAVPPAAITAIVGSLNVAVPVAQRSRASHWVSDCDVYVLTERPGIIGEPTWTTLRRPSEVVAVLEEGRSDFPLIVVDIPRELPGWIRPLLSRIRDGGVGLVRYVLDDDPSDEDLATWHGEIGRPSVLDLAASVPPARVLELLDRGEPVASVGGMPITADLLMALRLGS